MKVNITIPSPLTPLKLGGRDVFVKREDLIHPLLSGNKYRKLKYNILEAQKKNASLIISFGGAFSNHIHALAFTCQLYQIPLLLFIRGENVDNPTLDFVIKCGANIEFVSRENYRELKRKTFFDRYPEAIIIPEGGTNKLAVKGVSEMMDEIKLASCHFCVSYGSGGTSLGMMNALKPNDHLHVFSALKMKNMDEDFLSNCSKLHLKPHNTTLHPNYHFGGYAKYTKELVDFMNGFEIPLDPIYTGKLFFAVNDLIQKSYFSEDKHIVIIHSGGLQGRKGFNQRYGDLLS